MENINQYLETLQYDIEEINLYNMNLTNIPNLTRFTKVTKLHCSCNQLTELNNIYLLDRMTAYD
jgi:Leucine-rich repeat (LRR) protein